MARRKAGRTTLRDVPTNQLLCMRGALGHDWDPISKPRKLTDWGYRYHARCGRCSKERTTIFNIYGIEAAHYYDVPDWHVKIDEPYESADVRLEMLRRLRGDEARGDAGRIAEGRGNLRLVRDAS